jgi:hypothetical protein
MVKLSNTIEFPLIYCNGDSYSDDTYHLSLRENTYSNFVAKFFNGFALNNAISGSCNRRIIRSTIHDMIHQKQLNPEQHIIALIGLSFELRSEIWVDGLNNRRAPAESNFRTHVFSNELNWKEMLISGDDIKSPNNHNLPQKFFKQFSQGRAFFYSPYAERINLLSDLIMLRALLDSLNIKFIIFQSPIAEQLESDYLLDFLKTQIAGDKRFLDFETFGFCDWSYKQGFVPLDFLDRPNIGHYGPDAHKAFAEQILIPKLTELNTLP